MRATTLINMIVKRVIQFCAFFAALGAVGGAWAQTATLVSEEKAVFAGGCFWCMQPPFDHVPGVTATMRHIARDLRKAGWDVDYQLIANTRTFEDGVRRHIAEHKPSKLVLAEPN